MYHELEPWALTPFCVNMGLLSFKRGFPKIHDDVDVVWVANEMKSCGVKNLSSIVVTKHTPSFHICWNKVPEVHGKDSKVKDLRRQSY